MSCPIQKLMIRKATVTDIPEIVQACLTSTSKEETEGFSTPEWVTYLSPEKLRKMWNTENKLKDGSEIVVAEKDGKIVGFIVFSFRPDCAYIDNIDITKNEQRKGIGKGLVKCVEKIAIANRCFCIKTDTTENAEGVPWKSYGFWTRMGFEDTGERLRTKWSFKSILFTKELK